jgi:elongation factor Tu
VRRNFEAEIYVLKPEEGGRSKPFKTGYKPQAFVRTADVSCEVTLPTEKQLALPGDNFTSSLKIGFPLPLTVGLKFALREGGKTVAAGIVTKLLEDSEADIKEDEAKMAKKKAK